MAKSRVAPKRARTKILLPPRVKPDPANIGLRLTHLTLALVGPKTEGLVFRKSDGSKWGSIRAAFERACEDATVEAFRFRDLPITFASHFMMSTGDSPTLQKIPGHVALS